MNNSVDPRFDDVPPKQDNRQVFRHEFKQEDRRQDVRRVDDKTDLAELRGLAATIRNCQKTGHPDLSKHVETLLTKLGA